MFPRGLPLLCACVLAGCGDGNSLEDFSRRTLYVQATPISAEGPFEFSARLQREEPEAGCLRLRSSAKATLNNEPLMLFRGSETPDPDGPCGSPPVPPSFVLRGDAARFAGGPQDGLLEIRDGDERIVAEFRNLFARHALARPETPLTVKPGQEVFLAWDPPTDDLSAVTVVVLDNETFIQVTPEAGGLRVPFPADLPAGPARVEALHHPRSPLVRCEGVAACVSVLGGGPRTDRSVEVLVEP